MKVSREQAAQNREKIIEAAGRLFREHGFDGIGIADLMKDAGLTHGGFYGNFLSKEDLAAQVCGNLAEKGLDRWKHLASRHPEAPLNAIAEDYLSAESRSTPSQACLFATLGAEARRHDEAVSNEFTNGLKQSLAFLAGMMEGKDDAEKTSKAISFFAHLIGAYTLSSAVNEVALADQIMNSVLQSNEK
jgi:TetR/AcrR family transcriptional repressor of nem operon